MLTLYYKIYESKRKKQTESENEMKYYTSKKFEFNVVLDRCYLNKGHLYCANSDFVTLDKTFVCFAK